MAAVIHHVRSFIRKIVRPNGSVGQWKDVPINIHYLPSDGETRPRAIEFGQRPASRHRWSLPQVNDAVGAAVSPVQPWQVRAGQQPGGIGLMALPCGTKNQVAKAVAVDIPRTMRAQPAPSPSIRFTHNLPSSVNRGCKAEVDDAVHHAIGGIRKAQTASRQQIRETSLRIERGRADDQIADSVATNIACERDGMPGTPATGLADDLPGTRLQCGHAKVDGAVH